MAIEADEGGVDGMKLVDAAEVLMRCWELDRLAARPTWEAVT